MKKLTSRMMKLGSFLERGSILSQKIKEILAKQLKSNISEVCELTEQ